VGQAMELIPKLVQRVKKEMPEEFKHLEEGIEQAFRDGFDLKQDSLDNALLQAKQLVMSAKSALEEGSLEMVLTHVKAFEVLIDATYQAIEDGVLARDEAAATVYTEVEPQAEVNQGNDETELVQVEKRAEVEEVEQDDSHSLQQAAATSAPVEPEIRIPDPTPASETEHSTSETDPEKLTHFQQSKVEEERPVRGKSAELSEAERSVLLQAIPQLFNRKAQKPAPAVKTEEPAYEEEEYELVMPKSQPEQEEMIPEEEEQTYLVIETEDDALDELERISNTLVRVRQQIKRSYLPGIPDQLKYMFEEVVQTLGRVQTIMDQYRYDLEEVAMLVQDASDLVGETERMAERIITTCQMAEGAIQYTNRYRRQNRQVNELLTKAEISFRQLAFAEAYQLAEEARLVIEGAPAEEDNRWLLRRKKKG